MKKYRLLFVLKMTLVIFFLIGMFSALAIPKYFNLNKQNEASQCCANQVIVETDLAIVYAESLAAGSKQLPMKLTTDMFADGKIPTCPVTGKTIAFDRTTGKAFCPNHLQGHQRSH